VKPWKYLLMIVIAFLVCVGVRISGEQVRQDLETWKANLVITADVKASENASVPFYRVKNLMVASSMDVWQTNP
jgi:hypothetical protein